jgi:hypothetical protein
VRDDVPHLPAVAERRRLPLRVRQCAQQSDEVPPLVRHQRPSSHATEATGDARPQKPSRATRRADRAGPCSDGGWGQHRSRGSASPDSSSVELAGNLRDPGPGRAASHSHQRSVSRRSGAIRRPGPRGCIRRSEGAGPCQVVPPGVVGLVCLVGAWGPGCGREASRRSVSAGPERDRHLTQWPRRSAGWLHRSEPEPKVTTPVLVKHYARPRSSLTGPRGAGRT